MNFLMQRSVPLGIVFRLVWVLLLWLPLATNAQFSFVTNVDNTIRITAYIGTGGSVIVPDVTNGYPVTSIGNAAFNQRFSVTEVTIPNSVTNIGNFAFINCNGLTNVSLGSNVLTIGASAFQGCVKLPNVVLPNSVTNVGFSAFSGCSGLTNVAIGTNPLVLGEFAFRSCSGLSNVFLIGSNVVRIGSGAFAGSRITAFTVDPANPTYTAARGVLFNKEQTTLIAFPGSGAGSYAVSNGVVSVGDWAFSGCVSLTNVVLPATVTNLGTQAFSECASLASITLPGMKRIGGYAFYSCPELRTIVFPNTLTTIADEAFARSGLTSLVIPDSVTNVGIGAFETTPLKSVTVGRGLTTIPFGMFGNCHSLTNVFLPDTITYIDDYAFSECYSLSSITIPASVTFIDGWAFFHAPDYEGFTFTGTHRVWARLRLATYPLRFLQLFTTNQEPKDGVQLSVVFRRDTSCCRTQLS
jgi:hypothetical protein